MSLSVKIAGTEYAATRIRMRDPNEEGITGLATNANGAGAQGGMVVDDPDGDASLQGWDLIEVEESACTTAPRLMTGYLADRTERRGKYRDGPSREIDCTVLDLNALLSLRLIDGTDGNRPAEDRATRVAWIMGSDYLDGLVADLGLLASADSQPFEAADFRGEYASHVFDSISSGSIFFVYWDQSAAQAGVFFDLPDSTAFTSSLTISNDLADVDDVTCFAPYVDGEQHIDPSDVHSKHRLTWVGGVTVRNNATTAATFFPSPLLTRGFQTDSTRIGRAATAIAWTDAQLLKDSVERTTVTVTVRLPKEKVGLIDAGQRIFAKFTHLSGFQSGAYTRVEEKLIAPTDSRRDFYDVGLTLSTHGLVGGAPGGGGTGGFPNPPPTAVPPYYDDCLIGVAVNSWTGPGYSGSPTKVHFYNGDEFSCLYTVTQASDDGGSDVQASWQQISPGSSSFGGHAFGHPVGTVTATETWTVSGLATGGGDFAFVGTMNLELFKSAADFSRCAVLSLVTPGPENTNPPTGPGVSEPPQPGQWVYGEVVTMSTVGGVSTGTTAFPYASGSLINHVRVDGVAISAPSVVETDNTTGAFALTWQIDPDEVVTVDYQGI